ncbi:hypothetical protein [Chloroflexus sp.]|nr:hypothetical protein [uncultured Chloroflexus sp.]
MQRERITSVSRPATRYEMPYRLAQFLAVLVTLGAMLGVAAACNAIAGA